MESYPSLFLAHLAPLVVIQGLDPVSSKVLPLVETEDGLSTNPLLQNSETLFRKQPVISEMSFVEDVVKVWRKFHVDGVVWDSNSTKVQMPTHPHRYRFKLIDSSFALPKKAPDTSSPLSISNESSPLFPDGILTHQWLEKYRSITPSIFLSFYEINADLTDPNDIERIDTELASEINILKDQLASKGIRLLALIVSSRSVALNPNLDDRVNLIRRMTGLNSRNGLLFLPSATQKEVSTFAMDVLHVIKVASTEFYTNLDKKIRKKRAKVIGTIPSDNSLLKNRIEVRYSFKIAIINELKQYYEQAVKSYETSYENLIETFNSIPISDKNWTQFRLLLDVNIFHIVRLYFYMDQTNVAYRKFDVHLRSVLYFLELQKVPPQSFAVCNWLSLQFKWLAQLSDLAPVSLVPSDTPFRPFQNSLSPTVLPHSGYLYLQAADILRRSEKFTKESPDTYSSTLGSGPDFQESLFNLLTFSKLAFQKKDGTFTRSISYINFQLAEEYFKQRNFEKAFKLYEQASDSIKEDDWSYLSSFIHARLFECCVELKKHLPSVLNLLELALIPESQLTKSAKAVKDLTNVESGSFKNLLSAEEEEVVINAPSDSSFDLFECEVLFKETNIPLTKDNAMQIKLRSKLNSVIDSSVINNIVIGFDGTHCPIVLNHDESSPTTTQTLSYNEDKDCFIGSTNLTFKSYEEKIIRLIIPTKKIGQNTITSITGELSYHDYFKVNINIPLVMKPLQLRHIWYNDSGIEDIVATQEPSSFEVVPRVPDTTITVENIPKTIIAGEKIALPVKIYNTDHETVDVRIESFIEFGDSKVNCQCGSDAGEVFSIKDVEKEKDIMSTINFVAPAKLKDDRKPGVMLTVKSTFIVNGDEEVPILSVKKFDLALVDPLQVSIAILPRLKENDLPRVFEIKDGEPALPKPSRFWLMRANIVLNPDLDLELIANDLTLDVENPGLKCEILSDMAKVKHHSQKIECDHYFETVINDGHTYRNVTFDATLVLKWKRQGSETINEYRHESRKLSLPLLDPRVLLNVEPSEENNDLKLVYMLENPTTRVFSFSTTLIENQNFQCTGTKSLSQVSVLPCTRQSIVFHATPLATGWVQLPQLRVYDLNFRVSLPTLPISDLAQSHKSEVYVKIDDI